MKPIEKLPEGIKLPELIQKYEIDPLESQLVGIDLQIQRTQKARDKKPLQSQYDELLKKINKLKESLTNPSILSEREDSTKNKKENNDASTSIN